MHFVEAKTVNKDSPISMSSIFGGTYQDNSELRTGEERRRQTLCDKRDTNFV